VQFRLSTLFLLFVVLWSSMAAFDRAGVLVFIVLVTTVSCTGLVKSRWPRWGTNTAIAQLLVVVVVGLLWPAIGSCPEAVRRIVCLNNMKQIAMALKNYEKRCGCLPPPAFLDTDGRNMHSWRVAILPDLGHTDIYTQYDFNQPWDGPENAALLASRPDVFRCPTQADSAIGKSMGTNYLAVTGRNAAWRSDKTTNLNNPALRGRAEDTVLLIEDNSGIPWTQPRDVCLDDCESNVPSGSKPVIRCPHMQDNGYFYHETPAGAHVAFLSGQVRFLPAGCFAADNLKRLLVVGGCSEESIAVSGSQNEPSLHWPHCVGIFVWMGASGSLLIRTVRNKKTIVSAIGKEEHTTENLVKRATQNESRLRSK
jgi:hypothetical protein